MWRDKKFLYAISMLVGTIVGVGIFGIPFSFTKAGFLTGILFLILTVSLTILINLLYGEIVLRTKKPHFIIGFSDFYLGKVAKFIALFSVLIGINAALLAYIIVSGNFLANIFSRYNSSTLSIIFFIVASLIVLSGLKRVARFELIMVVFFIAIIFLIFGFGVVEIDFNNFTSLNFNKEFWFLPYGILLFAFSGVPAITLQREILSGKLSYLKKAIVISVLVPAALYLIFVFTVVGISGDTTSPEAISGLVEFLGSKVIFAASLFGILAIATSFLAGATILMETYNYDFKIKKGVAWILAVFIPFALYLSGVINFIEVISFAGAVSIGIEAILIVLIFKKAKKLGERTPEYSLKIPSWLLYSVAFLFALGAAYAFIY